MKIYEHYGGEIRFGLITLKQTDPHPLAVAMQITWILLSTFERKEKKSLFNPFRAHPWSIQTASLLLHSR